MWNIQVLILAGMNWFCRDASTQWKILTFTDDARCSGRSFITIKKQLVFVNGPVKCRNIDLNTLEPFRTHGPCPSQIKELLRCRFRGAVGVCLNDLVDIDLAASHCRRSAAKTISKGSRSHVGSTRLSSCISASWNFCFLNFSVPNVQLFQRRKLHWFQRHKFFRVRHSKCSAFPPAAAPSDPQELRRLGLGLAALWGELNGLSGNDAVPMDKFHPGSSLRLNWGVSDLDLVVIWGDHSQPLLNHHNLSMD